jgi:hypothetical protein
MEAPVSNKAPIPAPPAAATLAALASLASLASFAPRSAHAASAARAAAATLAALVSLASLASLAPRSAHAAPAAALAVDNALQACLAVRPGLRTATGGILLQDIALDVKQPLGACGCTSAMLDYRTEVVLEGGRSSPLQQGRFGATSSGTRTLTLASDTRLVGDRPIALSLHCAPAD